MHPFGSVKLSGDHHQTQNDVAGSKHTQKRFRRQIRTPWRKGYTGIVTNFVSAVLAEVERRRGEGLKGV